MGALRNTRTYERAHLGKRAKDSESDGIELTTSSVKTIAQLSHALSTCLVRQIERHW